MKKLSLWPYILAPFLVMLLVIGFKAASDTPFPPWVENITAGLLKDPVGGSEGHNFEKVVSFVYDVAADGGGTGAHGLGVYLPAGAIITQSFYKIITQFVDSGSGTVALNCEDANNILTAGDITGISANAITTGASTGSAATIVRAIGARCEITATVATVDQDAGKLIGFVRYIVGE